MSENGMDIQKRSVSKRTIKIKRKGKIVKEYPSYQLILPKVFAEKHNLVKTGIYLVADQIWFGIPDERTLMQILPIIPQIKELMKNKTFSEKNFNKLVELNPEVVPMIMKYAKTHQEQRANETLTTKVE